MVKTVHPLQVEPGLVLDIGMLTLQWARVEFTLKKIVVGLVTTNAPIGLLLAGDLGFRAMENFITCVIESKPQSKKLLWADLEALLAEARRLYALRNSFVHNTWQTGDDKDETPHLLVIRFRGKIQIYPETWGGDQREQIIEETVHLLIGLNTLARKHGLFRSFDRWEKRATSQGTVAQQRLANPRGRSPKTIEVLTRLRALSE